MTNITSTELETILIEMMLAHELTPDNVYKWRRDRKTNRLGRHCRTCSNNNSSRSYHLKRMGGEDNE